MPLGVIFFELLRNGFEKQAGHKSKGRRYIRSRVGCRGRYLLGQSCGNNRVRQAEMLGTARAGRGYSHMLGRHKSNRRRHRIGVSETAGMLHAAEKERGLQRYI